MSEQTDKGKIKIMQKVESCGSYGVMCTSGIKIRVDDGDHVTVVELKSQQNEAIINNFVYNLENPYTDKLIYVKMVTTLFRMVKGYGFTVLYDINGRIYIEMSPYFTNKVSTLQYLY